MKVDGGEKYVHCNSKRIDVLHKAVYLLMTSDVLTSNFNWVQSADDLYMFSSQVLALCHEGNEIFICFLFPLFPVGPCLSQMMLLRIKVVIRVCFNFKYTFNL